MPDINSPLDDDAMDEIKDKGTDLAREQLQGGGSDEDHEQDEEQPQENLQDRAESEAQERYGQD